MCNLLYGAILEAVSTAAGMFLKAENWSACLPQVLDQIGRATAVTRAYLLKNHSQPEGDVVQRALHQWAAPGCAAPAAEPHAANLPATGPACDFNRPVSDLLRSQGILSWASVPVFVGPVWWGSLAFADCEKERQWTDPQIEALKRLAWIVGAAIERSQRDGKLLACGENYRLLFESVGEGVGYVDPTETFTFANPAAASIFGVGRGELAGRSLLDFVTPEVSELICAQTEIRRSNQSSRYEHDIIRGDGSRRTLEIAATPRFDRNGKFEGTFGVFSDITERKRMEREFQALALVVENSSDFIGIASLDGHPMFVNPAGRRMLCLDEMETVTGIPDCLIDEDRQWFRERILPSVMKDGRWEGETRFKNRRTGAPLPMWQSIFLLGQGTDHPTAMATICRDIAERKRQEEVLRQSEFWLKESQRISRVGSYVTDLNTGLWTSSEAMDDVFGIGPAHRRDVEGWFQLVHPEDRHDVVEYFNKYVVGSGGEFNREYRIVRPSDGQVRWIHSRGALFRDSAGIAVKMAGTIQDITEQKLSREALGKTEEKLRQAQKLESIGRLAGGVAHDFNNLLTVINGHAELLLGRMNSGDPLRKSVSEIRHAGERAAGLTQQLLAFSRKQMVKPKPLDINRLVMTTRDMLQRLLGEDIELKTVLSPALGQVFADDGQMHQVLMNLAVNARDAMPDGGTLTIETSKVELDQHQIALHPGLAAGPYILLAVSDTGLGMDAQTQQQIFEPFFTTKSEGKGTGLGLATVHGIVRQSGGCIWVYSEPGQGSTFKVYLPRIEAAVKEGETVPAPRQRGSETVLVVEDQEQLRRLVVLILESYGYHVLQAADGGEALLLAASHAGPIHLMLTDVVMPRMTGREVAERLALARPQTRVLYMSGFSKSVNLDPGTNFIGKPFAPAALAAKVREVLGASRDRGRVLVVDDEEGVRSLFRQILDNAGYEVFLATDGRHALEMMERQTFDLVVTDLVMPEREGIETIQTLRTAYPGVKIVAVSGAFGGRFLKTAELLGAQATLIKPVSPDQLLATVRTTLA